MSQIHKHTKLSSMSLKNRGKGDSNTRSKNAVKRLKMYKSGGPIRNKKGKVIGGALMMEDRTGDVAMKSAARIAPNRRWFGNTRTIGAKQLDSFRTAMAEKAADPYSVVLRSRKLPMGLLVDAQKRSAANLLEVESYDSVFGPKKKRKKAKLPEGVSSVSDLIASTSSKASSYDETKDVDAVKGAQRAAGHAGREAQLQRQHIFAKGQSNRIWTELYKVLDSADVVVQVLDVRDPAGTRSAHVENYLKKHAKHKHLVFLLNKVDLVPPWITRRWVKILSRSYPTIAFHADVEKPFGKGALINLLQQFAKLHQEKQQISVGFIGYPNVGKSSVINTLKKKKVCRVAPIPGETKVWQYVTLMRRIYLIDCPGVVYDTGDDDVDIVLKGVVRAEKLHAPEDYVPAILERTKEKYIQKTYGIRTWTDPTDFLEQLARRSGKLLKGGEPNLPMVALHVIHDWQRGQIPYFYPPPKDDDDEEKPAASASGSAEGKATAPAAPAAEVAAAAAAAKSSNDEEDQQQPEEDNSELVDSQLNVVPTLDALQATMDAAPEAPKTTTEGDSSEGGAAAAADEDGGDDDLCWDDLDL